MGILYGLRMINEEYHNRKNPYIRENKRKRIEKCKEEARIKNEKLKLKENNKRICSECKQVNDGDNDYCIHCGHKLKTIPKNNRNYYEFCTICGERIDKTDNYCNNCGYEVKNMDKLKICSVCGEWNGQERYCKNCGHDIYSIYDDLYLPSKMKIGYKHICPNCKVKYKEYYHYCKECGTKLVRKWEL